MHIDSKSIILQGVGGPEETGSLIEAMKDYEILELGSSGFVAMEK
jgi:acetolactate synthase small subunit